MELYIPYDQKLNKPFVGIQDNIFKIKCNQNSKDKISIYTCYIMFIQTCQIIT